MLFLESKTLNHQLNTDARLTLLKDLQDRDLIPLIRSQRLRSFEDVLLGADSINEMETALAASIATRNSAMNSSADGVRWSGSFSSACRTTASIWGGTSMARDEKVGTSSVRCFFMIAGIALALNGTSPDNI